MEDDVGASWLAGRPDNEALVEIRGRSIVKRHCPSPPMGGEVEVAVVRKNHPYTLGPYDLMVQLFDRKGVSTLPKLISEDKAVAMVYWKMVVETARAMGEYLSRDHPGAKIIVSTNCAPFAVFSHKKQVQSLRAPHSHVVGYTGKEMGEMERVSDLAPNEKRIFNPANSPINILFHEIVRDLLPTYARDSEGRGIDDIGSTRYGRLRFSSNKDTYPYGLSFSVTDIEDTKDPEFLKRIEVFDKAVEAIYRELATIILENPEDIPNIGNSNRESVPLRVNSPERQMSQLTAFIRRHESRLRPQNVKALQKLIRMVNNLVINTDATGTFLRGYAYSIVIIDDTTVGPHENRCRVALPIFLFGGGGVESLGIRKARLPIRDPRNQRLTAQREALADADFVKHIVSHLHSVDAQILPVE